MTANLSRVLLGRCVRFQAARKPACYSFVSNLGHADDAVR